MREAEEAELDQLIKENEEHNIKKVGNLKYFYFSVFRLLREPSVIGKNGKRPN